MMYSPIRLEQALAIALEGVALASLKIECEHVKLIG